MEHLLKEILAEMKMQTSLLDRLVKISDSREIQTGEARDALRKAAAAFKGTPFEKIIGEAVKGGEVHGR